MMTPAPPRKQDKPRVEIVEERHEELSLLELDRLPREEKLRREQELLEGAHEVRYSERQFRPRHPASLDEVRERVDSLQVARRELPEVPERPTLPSAPAPAPQSIPTEHRVALEPVVDGKLVAVDVVQESEPATLVEASYETEGGTRKGLYLIENGRARPADAIGDIIDSLPVPEVAPPAAVPEEAPAAAAEPAKEPAAAPEKKRRFGLGRKKRDEPEPETPEPAQAEEPKKTGLFGRRKKDASEEAEGALDEAAEGTPKKRFSLRRKK